MELRRRRPLSSLTLGTLVFWPGPRGGRPSGGCRLTVPCPMIQLLWSRASHPLISWLESSANRSWFIGGAHGAMKRLTFSHKGVEDSNNAQVDPGIGKRGAFCGQWPQLDSRAFVAVSPWSLGEQVVRGNVLSTHQADDGPRRVLCFLVSNQSRLISLVYFLLELWERRIVLHTPLSAVKRLMVHEMHSFTRWG